MPLNLNIFGHQSQVLLMLNSVLSEESFCDLEILALVVWGQVVPSPVNFIMGVLAVDQVHGAELDLVLDELNVVIL